MWGGRGRGDGGWSLQSLRHLLPSPRAGPSQAASEGGAVPAPCLSGVWRQLLRRLRYSWKSVSVCWESRGRAWLSACPHFLFAWCRSLTSHATAGSGPQRRPRSAVARPPPGRRFHQEVRRVQPPGQRRLPDTLAEPHPTHVLSSPDLLRGSPKGGRRDSWGAS